jgi:aspartyl protease family protein
MMLKHAAILAVAVLSSVAAAQGLTILASSPAAAAKPAEAAPAPAEMIAVAQAAPASQAAQVTKAADGHFWAEADVNGRWVRFLVDTGASAVALKASDAERLGLKLDDLDFSRPVVTANGTTKAAAVKLAYVSVAGARISDVEALVVRDGLETSLLGMSYLGRLSRIEATKTALILRP